MTSWQIYWLTRMDYMQGLFIGLGAAVIFAGVGWMFIIAVTEERLEKRSIKLAVWGVIFLALGFFIPDTKEMATIVLIPKITSAMQSNEAIKKLPDNVLNLANEWIEELKPKHLEGK